MKPLFLRFDLSMAENRIVYVLSHDSELVKLANLKPWEFDCHTYNASVLFEKPEKEVTKAERQAGKKICHLGNYDGQAQRASDALLDEGFIIAADEVDRRREIYHARFPGIRQGYQLRTRMLVIQERKLTTSWGFEIRFPFERLDGSLWRRAYAWRPQSEVGYLLNQRGLIPAYEYITKHLCGRARLAFQVHDEVAIAIRDPDAGWELALLLASSLEKEREYEGEKLSIPADCALECRYHGRNGDCVEFKRFPEKEVFYDVFNRLARE